jgi:hypothetical protein
MYEKLRARVPLDKPSVDQRTEKSKKRMKKMGKVVIDGKVAQVRHCIFVMLGAFLCTARLG